MSVRLLGIRTCRFATSASFHSTFTLSYIILGANGKTETETYTSAKTFQQAFEGFRFTNPKTGHTFAPADLPTQHLDPSILYIAQHPFLTAHFDEQSHDHITDKAFENKACAALERHLQSHSIQRRIPTDSARPNSWRILGVEGHDIAEWEGIWESSDGHVFLLEAKHSMNLDKFPAIERKFTRSLDFLRLDPSKATVYLAGNHWSEGAMKAAQSTHWRFGILKFGILIPNGRDFDVQDPLRA